MNRARLIAGLVTAAALAAGLGAAGTGAGVWAGGGSRPFVFEFSFENGELKPTRQFAAIRDPQPNDHVGDVALSPDGRFLYAASLFRNSITVMNALTGYVVREIPTGRRPYRIVFAPDGNTFFVSHWADSTVGQYRASDGQFNHSSVITLLDLTGVANVVFSTDFPHPDCKYPGAVTRFLELPLPDDAKRAILWDNCARYYGLA